MATTKRDRILAVALQLFVEQGFRGTSTSQIAREAEVATGTLFHHFKNKEELIRELYLGAKFGLADQLERELAAAQDSRQQLRSLWFAFVNWAFSHEAEYRFFKHCEATPYINTAIRQQGEARFVFIYDLFAAISANRKDQKISQSLLIDLFLGMLNGFINHLMSNPEVSRGQDLWDNAFAFCWEAIS